MLLLLPLLLDAAAAAAAEREAASAAAAAAFLALMALGKTSKNKKKLFLKKCLTTVPACRPDPPPLHPGRVPVVGRLGVQGEAADGSRGEAGVLGGGKAQAHSVLAP